MRTMIYFQILLFSTIFVNFAFGGAITLNHRWTKNEIKVCWLNEVASNVYFFAFSSPSGLTAHPRLSLVKKIIKTAVSENFTLEDTGVSFIDWNECPVSFSEMLNYDFVINLNYSPYATDMSGSSTVGNAVPSQIIRQHPEVESIGKKIPGYINLSLCDSCDDIAATFSDMLTLTALHEFGHAAGLEHEDVHPNCPGRIYRHFGSWDKTDFVSEFDSQSVMSYGYFFSIQFRLGTKLLLNEDSTFTSDYWKALSKKRKSEINEWMHKAPWPSLSFWKDRTLLSDKYEIIPKLSMGDRHALRCLFKYSIAEYKQMCHIDFEL
jgi:hypothetical protein